MLLALLGALVIGLSLGLMGSGGSILTVPVLIYLVGQQEKVAIAGSLLVVGAICAVSGARAAYHRRVDWPTVLWFGIPGMAGTFLGAMLGGVVASDVQLLTFVGVMALAGVWMLRPSRATALPVAEGPHRRAPLRIVLDGLVVGCLTGFVGVGGGFLIVPALVLLGGLSMQRAVASSLVIIAMKSFTGFFKYQHVLVELDLELDWAVLGLFAGVGTLGSVAGGWFGNRLDQQLLRRIFAWLLVVMAIGMGIATVHGMLNRPAVEAGHG
ncbi:MAG: sulfite exporter TauE/SafE family protein [Planctomycetes bacterium]|nr:sulfite exporter TauE/SafE family protein [Planctomycetota bacterium]